MANGRVVEFILPTDPTFLEAKRLRYHVLYEPYGISPTFDWDDAAPRTLHVVAFERGGLCGYGRLDLAGDTAHIRHLCVAPAHQRQGVGTEVLTAILDRARAEGATLAFLNARFTALGIYRRFGFAEVGPIFHTEHTHLPHKRMELALEE